MALEAIPLGLRTAITGAEDFSAELYEELQSQNISPEVREAYEQWLKDSRNNSAHLISAARAFGATGEDITELLVDPKNNYRSSLR